MRNEKASHAQELVFLLNQIVRLNGSDLSKKTSGQLVMQFGEFCHSFFSFIEKYFKEENRTQLNELIVKLKKLHELAENEDSRLKKFSAANQGLSRQVAVNFPAISTFKTAEEFDEFLKAFESAFPRKEQQVSFAGLRMLAKKFIVVDPLAGRDDESVLTAGVTMPELSIIARSSPKSVDSAGIENGAATINASEEFDAYLKHALGYVEFTEGKRLILGDLRIEKFKEADSFFKFLANIFDDAKILELIKAWKKEGISISDLFETTNLSEQVADIHKSLRSLIEETLEIEVATTVPDCPPQDCILSSYAEDSRRFGRFIQEANQLLQLGHELRRGLLTYERERLGLIKAKSSESHVDIFMTRLTTKYLPILESILSLIGKSDFSKPLREQITKKVQTLKESFASGLSEEVLDRNLYIYPVRNWLSALEYGQDSITAAFACLQRCAITAAINKLDGFESMALGLSEERVEGFDPARIAVRLMTVEQLQEKFPLPALPPSRSSYRLPVHFAEPTVTALVANLQKTEVDSADSDLGKMHQMQLNLAKVCPDKKTPIFSPETAIAILREEAAVLLKKGLGYVAPEQLAVVYAAFAEYDSKSVTAALPFLPPELNDMLLRELELAGLLYMIQQNFKGSRMLRCFEPGEVYALRAHMTEQALVAIPPLLDATLEHKLQVITLNYFRILGSFAQLNSGSSQNKILLLTIYPLIIPNNGEPIYNYELGAFLAVIAVLQYRAYHDLPRAKILLLADASVPPGLKAQLESWLLREWDSELISEILAELKRIQQREAVSHPEFLFYPIIKDLLESEFCSERLEKGKEEAFEEAASLAMLVAASPAFGSTGWKEYCKYIERIDSAVAEKELDSFRTSWNKDGIAEEIRQFIKLCESPIQNNDALRVKLQNFIAVHQKNDAIELVATMLSASKETLTASDLETKLLELKLQESIHFKVYRTMHSYLQNYSFSRHHRTHVNIFLKKMDDVFFKAKFWTQAEFKRELLELFERVLDEYCLQKADYTPADFMTGSFCMRLFFVMEKLRVALCEEPAVTVSAGAASKRSSLRLQVPRIEALFPPDMSSTRGVSSPPPVESAQNLSRST